MASTGKTSIHLKQVQFKQFHLKQITLQLNKYS